MGRVLNYWKSTKKYYEWDIFYKVHSGDISTSFFNFSSPFKKLNIKKGFWAADPLLFERDGRKYLFFELFNKKSGKGEIACSILDDEKKEFIDYFSVLEISSHLSFPFVFKKDNEIYLIPENGEKNRIVVFKSINFPFEWIEHKTIVENISSSDSILLPDNEKMLLLASIKENSAGNCYNQLFTLDNDFNVVGNEICSKTSSYGIRNAGQIFKIGNTLYRPGQISGDNDYGQSIMFWEVLTTSPTFDEKEAFSLRVEDIRLFANSKKQYDGIHTFSKIDNCEAIDLRITKKRCFLSRVIMIFLRTWRHFIK